MTRQGSPQRPLNTLLYSNLATHGRPTPFKFVVVSGSVIHRSISWTEYSLPHTQIPLLLLALSTHIINFYWDWSTRHSDTHTDTPPSTNSTTLPDFSHLASHCAHISPISSSSFLLRQDALAQTLYALHAAAYIAEPGASAGFFGNVSSAHWGLSERPLLLLIQPQTDDAGAVHANISVLTPAFEATRAKMLPIPSEGGVTYTAWAEDADPYATALALVPSLENATIFVDGDVRMFVADGLQKAAQRARVTSAPVEVKRLRERKSSEELDIMKCVNEVRAHRFSKWGDFS